MQRRQFVLLKSLSYQTIFTLASTPQTRGFHLQSFSGQMFLHLEKVSTEQIRKHLLYAQDIDQAVIQDCSSSLKADMALRYHLVLVGWTISNALVVFDRYCPSDVGLSHTFRSAVIVSSPLDTTNILHTHLCGLARPIQYQPLSALA